MTRTLPARHAWTVAVPAIVLAALVYMLGSIVVAGLLVGLAAFALVRRPGWALAVAVAVPLAIEPDWSVTSGLLSFYNLVGGTKLAPVDICVLLAVAAGLWQVGGLREAVRRLGPLRWGLALLALGLFIGMIVGHDAGVGLFETINDGRYAFELFLVPVAVVCIVGETVPLRSALVAVFAFAALKSVVGVAAYAVHLSSNTGGSYVTYYYAPTNILVMFALAFLFAARLRRLTLPRWMWWSAPFLLASLTLSYRRSFWLGTLLAVALLFVALVGPVGRRLLVPAVAIIVLTFALTLSGNISGSWLGSVNGSTGNSTTSLSGRLLSINPTTLSANPNDRYRTEERRNVLADLSASPVLGLGLGVPYVQRYPESYETITHLYVHFAALWWWMKAGLVGLIGYVTLILTLVAVGIRVFLRHPRRDVAVAGIAAAAGTVGFAFAELTATFAGVDVRSSIVIGGLIGLLAVALRESRAPVARADAPDAEA